MPAETHVGRDRVRVDGVARCVREQITDVLDLDDAARLTDDADLCADLGADELTRIDLVEAIEADLGERTVGFAIDDEGLADVRTVGDLVDVVVARLERAGGLA